MHLVLKWFVLPQHRYLETVKSGLSWQVGTEGTIAGTPFHVTEQTSKIVAELHPQIQSSDLTSFCISGMLMAQFNVFILSSDFKVAQVRLCRSSWKCKKEKGSPYGNPHTPLPGYSFICYWGGGINLTWRSRKQFSQPVPKRVKHCMKTKGRNVILERRRGKCPPSFSFKRQKCSVMLLHWEFDPRALPSHSGYRGKMFHKVQRVLFYGANWKRNVILFSIGKINP